jgi:tight adherence protein B
MNPQDVAVAIALVVAVSVGVLAWFAVHIGTVTMARYRAHFTEQARFQAREFFLFIDPRRLFIANIGLMWLVGIGVWVLSGSLLVAFAACCLVGWLPRWFYVWMRKRRMRQLEEQMPDALLMLAGGLRAGASLGMAMQQLVGESVPPLQQELGLVLREQRLGVTTEQSLSNLARRVPTQTMVLVVSAMRIAAETGGGLAEALERTSATVRARLMMEGKIDALTTQGKLQAWVAGGLPIFLMLVLHKMEPDAMAQLWNTQMGWATLAVIAFLEVMGVYLIRRITAIDV